MTNTAIPTRTLSEVADFFSGGTPDRGDASYFGGSIPWVKSGEVDSSAIVETSETLTAEGVAHSAAKWCEPGATLVAMYGATAGKVGRLAVRATTNQAVLCVQSKNVDDGAYLYRAIQAAAPTLLGRTQGSGQPNLNAGIIKSLVIPWPACAVRGAVCRILDSLDKLLLCFSRTLVARQGFKHALLEELLTGRLRFPEFAHASVPLVSLGELATVGAVRNRGTLDETRVMGVLKDAGMVLMRDHVRSEDLSRYQIVPPNGFAYNPMRLNIGSIARNRTGADCLVSPDYVVFATDSGVLLPEYLDQVRRSHIWSDFVRRAGSGSVRVRIYFRDLAALRLPLPSLAEQRRITETLEAADREIALLKALCNAYETQKRALMGRLLHGDLALPEPVLAHV